MRGRPGPAPGGSALVLCPHRVLVALPVLAVGRIGDEVVEVETGQAVVRERAAVRDVVGVAPGGILHKEIGLRHGPRLRIDLLAEKVDLGARIDGRPDDFSVPTKACGDVLFGDHQHAAGAAAGVVDGPHHALRPDAALIASQHQIRHQMHDVSRRKVFARVLVQRLVELPDQLLEDGSHRWVVDLLRMQIDLLEPLQHLEQQPGLVQLADGVVEIELLQHFPHVGAEAGDVVAQVCRQVRSVGEELFKVVARGVVEREPGGLPQLRVEVLQLFPPQLRLLAQHLLLGGGQHAVEPPEYRERQNDVLVMAAPEGVPDEVRNAPEPAHDFAVVHGSKTRYGCSPIGSGVADDPRRAGTIQNASPSNQNRADWPNRLASATASARGNATATPPSRWLPSGDSPSARTNTAPRPATVSKSSRSRSLFCEPLTLRPCGLCAVTIAHDGPRPNPRSVAPSIGATGARRSTCSAGEA